MPFQDVDEITETPTAIVAPPSRVEKLLRKLFVEDVSARSTFNTHLIVFLARDHRWNVKDHCANRPVCPGPDPDSIPQHP